MRSKGGPFWLAVGLLLAAGSVHAILPIQHWQTKSGARVYFVENRDLPMLDVSVEFPAGAGFDGKEKSGAASMTNRLLRLGVEGMSEDEIARKLADVGAELSGSFDTDRAGVALRTLSSRDERGQALDVFARILQRPVFPEDVLEREKVRLVAALKEADTKPDTIAALTFYRLVYRDHPYALRSSGEVETVQRLTRQDLVDFYRHRYAARHAVVALIGDLSREEAAAIAEQITEGLPSDGGAELALPPVTALAAAATRIIAHPATQSHILIGALGIRRDDPDYFPLFVGNYVLGGGGFVSRITEEVRQKRGLAYSAYSSFSPLKQPGPFVIGMQTQREQAQEALKVVQNTLREFLAEGPTEQELKAAKQNLIGGFPLRIDSNRKIHGYLALIGFYRLPLTYLDDFVKNVEQVTVAGIRSAFARRLDPERMVTVVVGAAEDKTAASPAGN
ncbi:MAG: zinc protease [Betaproteobacteria bacterium RIFCSPLOWO2_12_FULL_62_58]|nr:MAG: zinc protease [Betaproteobacteria bacterium RIFCSPLOWO2_12_FULL_62_58]